MLWFQILIQIHSEYSYKETKTFETNNFQSTLTYSVYLGNCARNLNLRRGSGLIYSGSDSGFTNHSHSGPKIRPRKNASRGLLR
jgi:hypothetical protein